MQTVLAEADGYEFIASGSLILPDVNRVSIYPFRPESDYKVVIEFEFTEDVKEENIFVNKELEPGTNFKFTLKRPWRNSIDHAFSHISIASTSDHIYDLNGITSVVGGSDSYIVHLVYVLCRKAR